VHLLLGSSGKCRLFHNPISPFLTSERIFYETLYQQNPNSFMAQEYCILYGSSSASCAPFLTLGPHHYTITYFRPSKISPARHTASPYYFLSVMCPNLSIPGILDEEEAISVNKQVQARKLKGSGVSSPSPVKKAATVKKAGGEGRKRKSRLEDDVVVKTGLMEGGMEGVGSTAFA